MTHDEKLADIRQNPDKHRHDFDDLRACCMVNGALSLDLIDAHSGLLGSNGGVLCDTLEGPCACGAWHTKDEEIPSWSLRLKKVAWPTG